MGEGGGMELDGNTCVVGSYYQFSIPIVTGSESCPWSNPLSAAIVIVKGQREGGGVISVSLAS